VSNHDEDRLKQTAQRLDRLAPVPTDVLGEVVLRDGLCLWAFTEGDPPQLVGVDTPDRELAARLCAGCPVQDECLELELRWEGADTVGVWGALSEPDRRALYPLWRAHREETHPEDQEGGKRS
jgi:WhiB family redox-sensing transcriptional regulator